MSKSSDVDTKQHSQHSISISDSQSRSSSKSQAQKETKKSEKTTNKLAFEQRLQYKRAIPILQQLISHCTFRSQLLLGLV